MSDLGSQLSQLTPEQRQAIMMKAQQEANQQIMTEMMKNMVSACFDKCSGTSVGGIVCCCMLYMVSLSFSMIFIYLVLCCGDYGIQGDKLDSREQSCFAMCQDRYLETRVHVQQALQKRQDGMH